MAWKGRRVAAEEADGLVAAEVLAMSPRDGPCRRAVAGSCSPNAVREHEGRFDPEPVSASTGHGAQAAARDSIRG